MSQGTFDPGKRRLCPDGACIGVIGNDGRCRVCGRAGDGSAPASAAGGQEPDALDALDDDVPSRDRGDDDSAAGAEDQHALANGADGADGGFRPDRPLCDDGSCVGVIGSDGRCSVCGRAQGG